MRVHILGCGDAFGSGGRNQSAYLIETTDRLFLLDCGSTTLLAMKRAGFDPRDLDAVFLSHLHGDHFGGLPFFFIEYLYERPRAKALHLAGPPGSEERILQLYGVMYGGSSPGKEIPPICFHILYPGQRSVVEGIQVDSFRVPHQVNEISLALKISCAGKQLLFSGDSAWTEQFVAHARGVDLFLCECSFYDQKTTNHMNYLQIKDVLPRLECKRVILTHLGAAMLARMNELDIECAEDGMTINL